MGKHGPMILLPKGTLDSKFAEYLEKVRPTWTAPSDQLVSDPEGVERRSAARQAKANQRREISELARFK